MFIPKNGKAKWEKIYEAVRELEYGTLISYNELSTLMGEDFLKVRTTIYKVMRQLEANDQRTLIAVTNRGYKIAQPEEHILLTRRHHGKARHQLGIASSRIKATNTARLSPEKRKIVTHMIGKINEFEQAIRHLNGRVERHDRLIEDVSHRVNYNEEKLDFITQKMKEAGFM